MHCPAARPNAKAMMVLNEGMCGRIEVAQWVGSAKMARRFMRTAETTPIRCIRIASSLGQAQQGWTSQARPPSGHHTPCPWADQGPLTTIDGNAAPRPTRRWSSSVQHRARSDAMGSAPKDDLACAEGASVCIATDRKPTCASLATPVLRDNRHRLHHRFPESTGWV